jgi:hypothetical protein
VGTERLEEIQNPELAMDRAKAIYERKGYPKGWIDKRMRGINVRHTLTDEIYKGTFNMSTQEYKKHKSLS